MNTILGGGSRLNKLNKIAEHLSRNSRTVYVELTGDDVKGDGSVGKPFATVTRALQEKTGTTQYLTVELLAGDHNVGPIVLIGGHTIFTGAGRMLADAAGTHLFNLLTATIDLSCAVVDVSSAPFSFLVGLNRGAHVTFRADVSLVNATNFVVHGYGQNSLYAVNCAISSTAVVPKLTSYGNSTAASVQESSVTYTNIT